MKFHIHTYGCQMNVRDSEAVESLLLAAGHEKAVGEDDAELVIVNSCTVRQKAEEKAVGKAGNLIAAKKLTGLMGCAVKRLGADVFKKLPKLLHIFCISADKCRWSTKVFSLKAIDKSHF